MWSLIRKVLPVETLIFSVIVGYLVLRSTRRNFRITGSLNAIVKQLNERDLGVLVAVPLLLGAALAVTPLIRMLMGKNGRLTLMSVTFAVLLVMGAHVSRIQTTFSAWSTVMWGSHSLSTLASESPNSTIRATWGAILDTLESTGDSKIYVDASQSSHWLWVHLGGSRVSLIETDDLPTSKTVSTGVDILFSTPYAGGRSIQVLGSAQNYRLVESDELIILEAVSRGI